MTTRDTKEGIADLICELLGVNRTVSKMLAFLSFLKEND